MPSDIGRSAVSRIPSNIGATKVRRAETTCAAMQAHAVDSTATAAQREADHPWQTAGWASQDPASACEPCLAAAGNLHRFNMTACVCSRVSAEQQGVDEAH